MAEQRARLLEILRGLGFETHEAHSLIRIEMTLHRWAEHECNGNIQREGDDGEGKPRWHNPDAVTDYVRKGFPIPDRERGALKRLGRIIEGRNARPGVNPEKLGFYHQTDPRGAALYIIRPGDYCDGQLVESCYTRGICICGR